MIAFKNFLEKKITLDAMPLFASDLKKQFQARQVLLLCGPLGAGKTSLVKLLLESEGHRALSPSFAVYHTYLLENLIAYHVDLYRLKDDADLESTGFWDLFSDSANQKCWILIEWADRLKWDFLPLNWHYLCVRFAFPTTKEGHSDISHRLIQLSKS